MADRLRSPYEGARVEELQEPLLPRWFVLLLLASVPLAIGVGVWAFLAFGPEEVAVAERRPVPAEDSALTTAVGERNVGDAEPVEVEADCRLVEGIRAGGTALDVARIAAGINALCEVPVPAAAAERLGAFGAAGGVVRFAQFEATGVDSTMDLSGEVPVVLVNARLAREDTDERWITPLVVHDVTYLDQPVGEAASALQARRVEVAVCDALFTEDRPSRACDDATALLALPDPLAALQDAGYR